ncbi:unnamed protein product [Ectocarpus sp. CCAP 1310/34]|nr:unnamed protein product [Ectocarpus sp. CCAP 1310/34]
MELPAPDVEAYKAGNTRPATIMVSLIANNPPSEDGTNNNLARAFAFEIAAAVGGEYCDHLTEPEPMPSMAPSAAKVAAAEHPGLCGVYHAHILAAVKTQDVQARSGSTAGNKYRNQACCDGAITMNARGRGAAQEGGVLHARFAVRCGLETRNWKPPWWRRSRARGGSRPPQDLLP